MIHVVVCQLMKIIWTKSFAPPYLKILDPPLFLVSKKVVHFVEIPDEFLQKSKMHNVCLYRVAHKKQNGILPTICGCNNWYQCMTMT